ncbi:MAG: hypothetical protein ACFB11_10750 [Paracoccaceae bacterium]
MTDKFSDHAEGLSSPPAHAIAITPDDAADIAIVSRGLNVAESGAVRVTTLRGDTVTLFVGAGVVFPLRARRIHATGTTATGIVVMY